MQATISSSAVDIVLDDEIDRVALSRILSGARTDGEFLADLLEYAGAAAGLYADAEDAVVTDVPVEEEDGAISVGVWAYRGAESLGERLLRQGAASLVRVQ